MQNSKQTFHPKVQKPGKLRACFQANCRNKALLHFQVQQTWGVNWCNKVCYCPQATPFCYLLLHWGWKEECTTTKQCKWVQVALQCTALCSCYEECQSSGSLWNFDFDCSKY